MPERDPFVLRMLEKLGFNMTKLRWRLNKLEQRRDRLKEGGVMPERFRWLKFNNNIFRHCGALNDRDAGECYRCERRLPSLLGYRIGRLRGLIVPESAPRAIWFFVVFRALLSGALPAPVRPLVTIIPFARSRHLLIVLRPRPLKPISSSFIALPVLSSNLITTCSPHTIGAIAIRRSIGFPSTATVN